MHRSLRLALLPALVTLAGAQETAETLLLQQPTISGNHIVFVYADDLWIVPRDGGDARRLTSSPGSETSPRLSPDGRLVAFTGEYEGNADVYVLSVDGGEPERLTWHPGGDSVCDWHPDGERVLFRSSRNAGSRYQTAFLASLDGGPPEPLPLPRVAHLAYDADASHIAYTPVPDAFRSWKRYRGGRTTPLWIYDTATHEVEVVPHVNASDTFPTWVGDDVYFGSDRDGVMNVHRFRPGSNAVEQLTHFTDFHVRNIDADGDALVFEQAGALHLFTPTDGLRRLQVRVRFDGIAALPRWQKVQGHVRAASIAPNGQRAVFEARGEIVTLPREHGSPRNLTQSPGAHDRSPAWSPDGESIAWFSDRSGEYELIVQDHRGRGELRAYQLDRDDADTSGRETGGFYYTPRWSPGGERILFQDKFNRLAYIDLESSQITSIAHSRGSLGVLRISATWSPDGKWIAFTERDPNTAYDRIVLHDVGSGDQHPLTDGFAAAGEPAFSRDGKFLFFVGSTDSGPRRFGLDLSSSAARDATGALYVAVLQRDAANPLAPREDEAVDPDESDDDAEDTEDENAEDTPKKKSKKKDLPALDIDGIDQRILALPLGSGRYGNLVGIDNGLLYVLRDDSGSKLARFDFEKREAETVLPGVRGFGIAADGKHLLISEGRGFAITDLKGKERKALPIDEVKVRVQPAKEWAQTLREVWRIQRDYFYDPNMHGIDWPAMWERWQPFLAHVRHRADLNMVVAELIGEIACGHQYVSGGEMPDGPEGVSVGLLGADYDIVDGRYRIARILEGQNWNPGLRAPLTEPGVHAEVGEFVLSVDGRPLHATDNIHALFVDRANRRVELELAKSADGGDARTVTVVPVRSERNLRQRSWIEANRARVEEASGGRLAYVYMPNTGGAGLAAFERDFFSQLGKQGLILDERYNGGGKVADYVIDVLSRDVMCYWMNREGWLAQTPFGSFDGPKVMVVNEMAGSGGDAMPWLFQRAGLGPLVGTRTWGGLVGISGYPPLMDGGRVTAASFGVMDTDGEWAVENVGVAPDFEVLEFPKEFIAGGDPQLDRAIEVALHLLESHEPRVKPTYQPPSRR